MYYDRFDICAAYYHFAYSLPYFRGMQYNYSDVLSKGTKYALQLNRIRYKPGLSDSNLSTMSKNAKLIYINLVKKHLAKSS